MERMRDSIRRFHPSTTRNKRIFIGSEMICGGSIIIPRDISIELTIMSITRKGMKMIKPI
jgi:hypothetical protein